MTFAQLWFHLANFVLPALAMAVLMPLAGHWVMGTAASSWRRRILWHAVAGMAVLLGGVLIEGHDGRMATYLALVIVAATVEWLLHRGWRA